MEEAKGKLTSASSSMQKKSTNSEEQEVDVVEMISDISENVMPKRKLLGKRQQVDGSYVEDFVAKRNRINALLDEAILAIIDDIRQSAASKVDESKIEKSMLSWMKKNDMGIADLLEHSDFSNSHAPLYRETFDLITFVGLQTVINIFCSRGQAFARDSFNSSMKELDFKPVMYLKLYFGLNKWRQCACDYSA